MLSGRRLHFVGAALRLSGIVNAIVLSIVAPKAFGADAYGVGVAILAIPFAVQGLLEPAVNSIAISCAGSADGKSGIAALLRFIVIGAAMGWVALSVRLVLTDSFGAGRVFFQVAIPGLFLAFYLLNTLLTGLAYGQRIYTRILCGYAFSGVAFVGAVISFSSFGTVGLYLSTLVWQISLSIIYLTRHSIRHELIQVWHEPSTGMWSRFRTQLMPAMASRVSLVSLNTFSLIWYAAISLPAETAAFKVTLALAGLVKFAVPVSPEILQAAMMSDEASERRRVFVVLILSAVSAVVVTAGMFYVAEPIRVFLLGSTTSSRAIDWIIVAAPFLFLIGPISSVLFAMNQKIVLLTSAAACVSIQFALSVLNFVSLSVAVGSICFVAVALAMMLSRGSERSMNLLPNSVPRSS